MCFLVYHRHWSLCLPVFWKKKKKKKMFMEKGLSPFMPHHNSPTLTCRGQTELYFWISASSVMRMMREPSSSLRIESFQMNVVSEGVQAAPKPLESAKADLKLLKNNSPSLERNHVCSNQPDTRNYWHCHSVARGCDSYNTQLPLERVTRRVQKRTKSHRTQRKRKKQASRPANLQ